MPITNIPLTVLYFIDDISSALATFDSIRWWKSSTGQNGLYERVTDVIAAPARLTGTRTGPFYINGLTLSLIIDGVVSFEHEFVSADPVTIGDLVSELNTAASGILVASNVDGALRISSPITGTGSSVQVVATDGSVMLGLSGTALGVSLNTPLAPATHEYAFTDQNSDYSHWYRAELYHSVTLDRSELSPPFPGSQVQALPVDQTIVGYVRLVTPDGRPDNGRKLVVFNDGIPNTRNGYGVVRFFLEAVTDRTGYAQVRLVRGITVSFNLAGTGVTRKIQVPTTGDSFNLLDEELTVDDAFSVQYQDVPFATRTS